MLIVEAWRTVCNAVQDLAGPGFELQTSRTRGTCVKRLAIKAVVKNYDQFFFNLGLSSKVDLTRPLY